MYVLVLSIGRRSVLKYINFNARIPCKTPRSRAAGARREERRGMAARPRGPALSSEQSLRPRPVPATATRARATPLSCRIPRSRSRRAPRVPSCLRRPTRTPRLACLSLLLVGLTRSQSKRICAARSAVLTRSGIVFSAVLMLTRVASLLCYCSCHWICLLMVSKVVL